MHTKFWLEILRETGNSEDRGVDGKTTLEWILGKIGWECVNWLQLAQDRDQWWALLNMLMDLRVP